MVKFLRLEKNQALWLCHCDCDINSESRKEVLATTTQLTRKRSNKQSCGCIKTLLCSTRFLTYGLYKHPYYRIWTSMKARCYYSKHKQYKDYGGRGIKVCKEWLNSFVDFLVDMGRKPSKDYQLDRIDNDKDYCFENCRWVSKIEQMNNRRNTIYLIYKNEKKSLSEWSRTLGISRETIRKRIKLGWSIEKILGKTENE